LRPVCHTKRQATFLPGNGLAEFAAQDRFHDKKAYDVFPVRAFSEGLTKTTPRAAGGHPRSPVVKALFNATFMVVMMRFKMIIRQAYTITLFCQLLDKACPTEIQPIGPYERVIATESHCAGNKSGKTIRPAVSQGDEHPFPRGHRHHLYY
jgi:hypothetical protein